MSAIRTIFRKVSVDGAARQRRAMGWIAACLLTVGWSLSATAAGVPATSDPCPESYDLNETMDYLDPSEGVQVRIRGFERNHLNSNVESLIRGQSTASPAGDLKFILALVPNHHRAMQAMMRMAIRDKTDRLPESEPYTVRCWLHRGTVASPKDGNAVLILGIYVARLGDHRGAVTYLEEADRLLPEDMNVDYNLGLVYFELKDYAKSLERAKRAYARGFPLPGLRQKLTQAGKWKD